MLNMSSTTIKKRSQPWIIVIVVVALIGGIIWLAQYNITDASALKNAEIAYESGDFETAHSLYEDFFNKYARLDVVGNVSNPWLFLSFDAEETVARRWEVRDMTAAEQALLERNYSGAIWEFGDVIGAKGRYSSIAQERLKVAVLGWYEDTGESGRKLLSAMYELACVKELSPDDYRIALSNYDAEIQTALYYAESMENNYPIKYWFPDASMGENVARAPAEFKVAVCFDIVEKTNVEGCAYAANPQNPQGFLGSVSRKRATYITVLINPYTGERLAEGPSMLGAEPPQCPSSIVGGGMYEYIGPPDYEAALPWIEENFLGH